jgi:hypothetical protein
MDIEDLIELGFCRFLKARVERIARGVRSVGLLCQKKNALHCLHSIVCQILDMLQPSTPPYQSVGHPAGLSPFLGHAGMSHRCRMAAQRLYTTQTFG